VPTTPGLRCFQLFHRDGWKQLKTNQGPARRWANFPGGLRQSPLNKLQMIHPTAVIDPKAELDSDVKVGPYALIEGSVRIGSGTEFQGHAVISGCTRVGKNNRIGYGAIIGSFPQDLSFNPKVSSGVQIGDNNVIREYCTIHRGTKEGSNTSVGSNNLFMVGAHLGHNTRVADHVILANNVLLG